MNSSEGFVCFVFFPQPKQRNCLQYQLPLCLLFFQQERDTVILIWSLQSLRWRTRGKGRNEIKFRLLPYEARRRSVSTVASTDMLKLCGIIKKGSLHDFSKDQKHWGEIVWILFLGKRLCLKSPVRSMMKTFFPQLATSKRFKYNPVIFA